MVVLWGDVATKKELKALILEMLLSSRITVATKKELKVLPSTSPRMIVLSELQLRKN